MLFSTLALVASLLGLSSAATIDRRSIETVYLYAYGTNISGLNVFYGDGLAWIGYTTPDWLSETSNITFTYESTSETTAWTVNSNSSLWTDGAYEMYIIPTAGSFEQVGFISTNGTVPTGATTTGFYFYGTQVVYVASESDWEFMFWGVSTNTTGIWQLMWNAASEAPEGSTPITLKKVAPATITADVPADKE